MTEARLTTIIPWCQRPELERTLRHNRPFFEVMRSDIVVVNCGGDDQMLRQLLASSGLPRATQVNVPAGRFSRSLAANMGVHAADADVVFVLDADILLTSNLRRYADACADGNCYAIIAGMKTIPPKTPEFERPPGSVLERIVIENSNAYHWSDGSVTRIVQKRHDVGTGRRLAPGIMFVRKQHVLDIGGYRSDLVGWGWEDLDIQVRLVRVGLECIHAHDEIRHLDHGHDKRDLDRPLAVVQDANRVRVWDAYSAGAFTGTYYSDVETWGSASSRPALA